jgi:hypothetical protein
MGLKLARRPYTSLWQLCLSQLMLVSSSGYDPKLDRFGISSMTWKTDL